MNIYDKIKIYEKNKEELSTATLKSGLMMLLTGFITVIIIAVIFNNSNNTLITIIFGIILCILSTIIVWPYEKKVNEIKGKIYNNKILNMEVEAYYRQLESKKVQSILINKTDNFGIDNSEVIKDSLESKLSELKSLLDKGILSNEEYEDKRKQIIEKF